MRFCSSLALLAGEVEHLVVGDAPHQLQVVPGQLGEHHAVDRPARAQARVAVRGAGARRRGASWSPARWGGSPARSSRCRWPRATPARRADRPGPARPPSLGPEHAEEAQRVEVERVRHGQDEEPAGLQRRQRRGLEVAARGREERRELRLQLVEEAWRRRGPPGGTPAATPVRAATVPSRRESTTMMRSSFILSCAARRAASLSPSSPSTPRYTSASRTAIAHPRPEHLRADARPDRELLARRREEEADVMDQAEGEHHPEALQPLQPAQRAQRQRRRLRAHLREGQRSERAGDGRIVELGVGDGHGGHGSSSAGGRARAMLGRFRRGRRRRSSPPGRSRPTGRGSRSPRNPGCARVRPR